MELRAVVLMCVMSGIVIKKSNSTETVETSVSESLVDFFVMEISAKPQFLMRIPMCNAVTLAIKQKQNRWKHSVTPDELSVSVSICKKTKHISNM